MQCVECKTAPTEEDFISRQNHRNFRGRRGAKLLCPLAINLRYRSQQSYRIKRVTGKLSRIVGHNPKLLHLPDTVNRAAPCTHAADTQRLVHIAAKSLRKIL